jgi:type I restriction enzyme S subunit
MMVLPKSKKQRKKMTNYKRLGDYIQPVDERNTALEDLPLMGLSITKEFIPSIANTIGTDMSTYRIIERNQFAYGPVTSRNGNKITIALFDDYERALISQAYIPFKVKDTNKLNPEYLMMWFRRPEFDRYARFKSHGSAREIFDWEEMCSVELPVPPIEKQREIVAEYNAVQKKIDLNNQLIQKLEETAQAIYKRWFVEGIDLEDLPEGWRKSKIGDEVETLGGGTPSTENEEYWIGGDIVWYSPTDITNNNSVFIFESSNRITKTGLNKSSAKLFPINCLMMTSRATVGKLAINTQEATTNQGFITMIPTEELNVFYLYCWANTQIEEIINLASGSTFLEISKTDFRNLAIIIPDEKTRIDFGKNVTPSFELIKTKTKETKKLTELKELLLSKLATIYN